MNASSDTSAYGRLAIGALAMVTIGSAAALTIALAVIAAAPRLPLRLPYGDVPAALLAIGAAASLASLSSAAAYLGRVCGDRDAARAAGVLRAATYGLMTCAYLAFAAGGLVFTHFCLAAVGVFARLGATG
ncbi:MAG: hypothetical protein INR64_08600 [Caulobacteraceae bacterium]|nr:hypothetical protein [Caulobacter sp.]